MSKTMLLQPRLSEKTYGLSKERSTYVFNVPVDANKLTVAAAVEAQFKVKVETVNIVIAKGKVKQSYRKRSRPVSGKRSDIKKAYVRVAKGDEIPVFAAVDQEVETAAKATKKEKK